MAERTCWSCHQPHTGSAWCPHCSAPVDLDSPEARRSPYWAVDPRNPSASALYDPDDVSETAG